MPGLLGQGQSLPQHLLAPLDVVALHHQPVGPQDLGQKYRVSEFPGDLKAFGPGFEALLGNSPKVGVLTQDAERRCLEDTVTSGAGRRQRFIGHARLRDPVHVEHQRLAQKSGGPDPLLGSLTGLGQSPLQESHRFGVAPGEPPIPPGPSEHPESRGRTVRLGQEVLYGQPQVGVLLLEPSGPHRLQGPVEFDARLLGVGQIPLGMGDPQFLRFRPTGLSQPFGPVLSQGLEHPETDLGPPKIGHHQALVDQRGQEVGDLGGDQIAESADGFGGFELEATGEHGQPSEQDPLGLREQVERPVDQSPQGLLARQGGAVPSGEKPEAMLQTVVELPQRHRPQLGGGQFNGQRHPIEAATDGGDQGELVLGREAGY